MLRAESRSNLSTRSRRSKRARKPESYVEIRKFYKHVEKDGIFTSPKIVDINCRLNTDIEGENGLDPRKNSSEYNDSEGAQTQLEYADLVKRLTLAAQERYNIDTRLGLVKSASSIKDEASVKSLKVVKKPK